MYKDRIKYLAAQKRYNDKNKKKKRELARLWRLKNKKKKSLYDREYQKIYSQRPDVIIKNRARKKIREAIRTGKIKRLPCKVCGVLPTQAHHKDYSKPFNVVWLCRIHHEEIHHSL